MVGNHHRYTVIVSHVVEGLCQGTEHAVAGSYVLEICRKGGVQGCQVRVRVWVWCRVCDSIRESRDR